MFTCFWRGLLFIIIRLVIDMGLQLLEPVFHTSFLYQYNTVLLSRLHTV